MKKMFWLKEEAEDSDQYNLILDSHDQNYLNAVVTWQSNIKI